MKNIKKKLLVFFIQEISFLSRISCTKQKIENNYNTNEFHKLFLKSDIEIWKTIRRIYTATDAKIIYKEACIIKFYTQRCCCKRIILQKFGNSQPGIKDSKVNCYMAYIVFLLKTLLKTLFSQKHTQEIVLQEEVQHYYPLVLLVPN